MNNSGTNLHFCDFELAIRSRVWGPPEVSGGVSDRKKQQEHVQEHGHEPDIDAREPVQGERFEDDSKQRGHDHDRQGDSDVFGFFYVAATKAKVVTRFLFLHLRK